MGNKLYVPLFEDPLPKYDFEEENIVNVRLSEGTFLNMAVYPAPVFSSKTQVFHQKPRFFKVEYLADY